jgi:hypothetical protein
MPSRSTSPSERLTEYPGPEKPSRAVTALLLLTGLGLWLGVLRACFLLLVQRLTCREARLVLPQPANWLFGLSWWEWFSGYWWLIVLGFLVLAPVVVLTTYWVRHGMNSRLGRWAWGILLIVPPLLLLELAVQSLSAANLALLHGTHAEADDPANYLAPDRQELGSPLRLREVRRGVTGPDGEIVVIEPAGEWRVIPGIREGGPPLRQGKLTAAQVALLADHLARQKFLVLCKAEEAMPPVTELPLNQDMLVIEFGDHHVTLEGGRRRQLQQVQDLDPWEADFRSRFVPLVLIIDDLIKPGAPD